MVTVPVTATVSVAVSVAAQPHVGIVSSCLMPAHGGVVDATPSRIVVVSSTAQSKVLAVPSWSPLAAGKGLCGINSVSNQCNQPKDIGSWVVLVEYRGYMILKILFSSPRIFKSVLI